MTTTPHAVIEVDGGIADVWSQSDDVAVYIVDWDIIRQDPNAAFDALDIVRQVYKVTGKDSSAITLYRRLVKAWPNDVGLVDWPTFDEVIGDA
jgi:hypothetical protein